MTLEELQQQVDKDFKLDDTELDSESIKSYEILWLIAEACCLMSG